MKSQEGQGNEPVAQVVSISGIPGSFRHVLAGEQATIRTKRALTILSTQSGISRPAIPDIFYRESLLWFGKSRCLLQQPFEGEGSRTWRNDDRGAIDVDRTLDSSDTVRQVISKFIRM
ncbi:MAG: hypothetical protein OEZ41_04540 [Nitrospirota bacterium]|nr:hypothetical protein [Nitrospirota bacterium]MDH5699213.1 hypothetical protein [Nitrospirota bacterium]